MRLLPPGGEDGRDAREDPGNHHDRDWPRVGAVGHGGGRGWRSNAGRGTVGGRGGGDVVVTCTLMAIRGFNIWGLVPDESDSLNDSFAPLLNWIRPDLIAE